jgi:hypothetical protein
MNLVIAILGTLVPQDGFKWQDDLDAAFRQARDGARPLLVVFR